MWDENTIEAISKLNITKNMLLLYRQNISLLLGKVKANQKINKINKKGEGVAILTSEGVTWYRGHLRECNSTVRGSECGVATDVACGVILPKP